VRARSLRPAGKVNLIGVGMLLAVCAGIWWVVIYGPLYSDHMDVTEIAGMAVSEMGNRVGEESATLSVVRRCAGIGTHKEIDEMGEEHIVPGLGVRPEDVTIEANEKTKKVKVSISYTREVVLRPFKTVRRVHFVASRSGVYVP